jgi:hypothetical protein
MSEIYKKDCPKCGKEIIYKSKKGLYNSINYLNSLCKECGSRKNGDNKKESYKGESNPFYGKHHSEDSKKKIVKSRIENDFSSYKTDEFRNKMSKINSGKNNAMHGKKFYDIWVEKYGEEEANKRLTELKNKHSINSTGEKNSMYGKPSPQGSGNGWSGWYKGKYFRSLRELSFIIEYLEKNNLDWISAEKNKYKIDYIDPLGHQRTYRPDYFIVNENLLIDIKPIKLWDTPTVKAKKKAAELFCINNGYEFKLQDCEIISFKKILDLIDEGHLIFLPIYEKKLKEWIENNGE